MTLTLKHLCQINPEMGERVVARIIRRNQSIDSLLNQVAFELSPQGQLTRYAEQGLVVKTETGAFKLLGTDGLTIEIVET